ncbi:MAG: hypothetical protein HZA20_13040 [Nitrospirae bacterium]|nr:hypothetical protein [Nitrospirota bacterium]
MAVWAVLFASVASAAGPDNDAGAKPRQPVVITSRTMEADNQARKARFSGEVTARTESAVIHADRMDVFYSDDSGRITRIECAGNVRVVRGERAIVAESAVFFGEEERMEFSGYPRIIEGENLVSGSRITYYPKSDKLTVEESRVYMKQNR